MTKVEKFGIEFGNGGFIYKTCNICNNSNKNKLERIGVDMQNEIKIVSKNIVKGKHASNYFGNPSNFFQNMMDGKSNEALKALLVNRYQYILDAIEKYYSNQEIYVHDTLKLSIEFNSCDIEAFRMFLLDVQLLLEDIHHINLDVLCDVTVSVRYSGIMETRTYNRDKSILIADKSKKLELVSIHDITEIGTVSLYIRLV